LAVFRWIKIIWVRKSVAFIGFRGIRCQSLKRFAEFIRRALCHSQALAIRQRVFVFQNSLFAAQPNEELWMRMNTGAEQQGEGWLISYWILNGARRWPLDSRHVYGFQRLTG